MSALQTALHADERGVAQSGGTVLSEHEPGRGVARQLWQHGRTGGRHLGPILAQRNFKPQRYEWRADGKMILEKTRRAREALARLSPVKKDTSETQH